MTDTSRAPRAELAEVIRELKGELRRAMEEGEDQAPALRVNRVEVELRVNVEQRADLGTKTRAGLRFPVISVGASLEGRQGRSQGHGLVIRLDMTPLTPDEAATARPKGKTLLADD